MKNRGAILEFFQIRCVQLDITRDEAAKRFKVTWQYLYQVLTYVRPMPQWMVKKMAAFLEIDEGVVGIAFGYYPVEWIFVCQHTPEAIYKQIKETLGTVSGKFKMQGKPVREK